MNKTRETVVKNEWRDDSSGGDMVGGEVAMGRNNWQSLKAMYVLILGYSDFFRYVFSLKVHNVSLQVVFVYSRVYCSFRVMTFKED